MLAMSCGNLEKRPSARRSIGSHLLMLGCLLLLLFIELSDARSSKKKSNKRQENDDPDPVGTSIGQAIWATSWEDCGQRPAFEAQARERKQHVAKGGPKLGRKRQKTKGGRNKATNRMMNGDPVLDGQYPSYAFISLDPEHSVYQNLTLTQACGGVLVGRDTVLTAAHCLMNRHMNKIRVYLGLSASQAPNDFKGDWAEHAYVVRSVCLSARDTCLTPEIGNTKFYAQDVAILRLTRMVMYSDYVQPACFPPVLSFTPATRQSNTFEVVGRGLSEDFPGGGGPLKKMVIKSSLCTERERQQFNDIEPKTRSLKCTRGERGGLCWGDSGSPAFFYEKDSKNQTHQVLGGLVMGGTRSGLCQPRNETSDIYAITDSFAIRYNLEKLLTTGGECQNPYGLEQLDIKGGTPPNIPNC